MQQVHIPNQESLLLVKNMVRKSLKDVKSAHLSEALAASLGHKTAIALKVWVTNPDRNLHSPASWSPHAFFHKLKDLGYQLGDMELFDACAALGQAMGTTLILNADTNWTSLLKSDYSTIAIIAKAHKDSEILMSSRLNPLTHASSATLITMLLDLMDPSTADGAMWRGRANLLLNALIPTLCWARDSKKIPLTIEAILTNLAFAKIIKIDSGLKFSGKPQQLCYSYRAYLTSLPGYVASKGKNQHPITLAQHQYLEMEFTKILRNLNDVYGWNKKPSA